MQDDEHLGLNRKGPVIFVGRRTRQTAVAGHESKERASKRPKIEFKTSELVRNQPRIEKLSAAGHQLYGAERLRRTAY